MKNWLWPIFSRTNIVQTALHRRFKLLLHFLGANSYSGLTWHCLNMNTGRAWEQKQTDNEAAVKLAEKQEKSSINILYLKKKDTSAPLTKRSKDSYGLTEALRALQQQNLNHAHKNRERHEKRWPGAWRKTSIWKPLKWWEWTQEGNPYFYRHTEKWQTPNQRRVLTHWVQQCNKATCQTVSPPGEKTYLKVTAGCSKEENRNHFIMSCNDSAVCCYPTSW